MRCAKLPNDSKLYHHVSITVSDDELETIDKLVSDFGFRNRGDLQRTALETYTKTKIFRPRESNPGRKVRKV